MSRKTSTGKAVLLAAAVAATSLYAGTASAATPVVTKVGPALAGTSVALPLAISGTGFDDTIQGVAFQKTGTDTYVCNATKVVVVSSTLLYAVKPTSGCVDGVQKVELHSTASPSAATTRLGDEFAAAAAKTVTFVTPVAVSSASVSPSTGVAGTPITVTGLVGLATSGVSATLGGKPVTGLKVTGTTGFTGVAPAGINVGDAPLQVKSGGVLSSEKAGVFAYKPTITVSPAFAPKGSPGQILITGLGLKPASPATVVVTVCGVVATQVPVTAAKPHTDTKYWVTAPTAQAIEDAATDALESGESTFNEDGGACVVKVKVDVNGATADVAGSAAVEDDPDTTEVDETAAAVPAQVNPTSVVTKDSVFTYAAY